MLDIVNTPIHLSADNFCGPCTELTDELYLLWEILDLGTRACVVDQVADELLESFGMILSLAGQVTQDQCIAEKIIPDLHFAVIVYIIF